MSKVSVFKFNANGQDQIINQIMTKYINTRGLVYEPEKGYYQTPVPGQGEQNKEMLKAGAAAIGASVLAGVLSGGRAQVMVAPNMEKRCFTYQITNGILVIKAFTTTYKNDFKNVIHSTFNSTPAQRNYYNDLKNSLFKELEQYHVTYIDKETLKVNDGVRNPAWNALLIIFIIFGVIALVFYLLFIQQMR